MNKKTKARYAKPDRARQRVLDRLLVERFRDEMKKQKRLRAAAKAQRRAALGALSRQEARAWRAQEKTRLRQERRQALQRAVERRAAYAALSPAKKRVFRRELARFRRLKKRAMGSSAGMQLCKYVLLAALLGVLFYAGEVAYSAWVDNAAAFSHTARVIVRPSAPPAPSPDATPGATPKPTMDPYELLLSQGDLDFMKNRVNILVLGIDESLERAHWESFRTDTMILLSVNFETGAVDMISLPRDSYVWIYGAGERDKINSAFARGGGYKKDGFTYTMNTVQMALGGVSVNHYVCFDMNVVKEVVNAIGGLHYDVDVDVRMGGRRIEKGHQYMDGQKVLDYCRQRKGSSDIERTDRQQRMILAIFDEIRSSGRIKDIPAIYAAVTGNIYTDLTPRQIASLAAFALNVEPAGIRRHTLPGGFLNLDGTSFWGIDQQKTRRLVNDIFGAGIKVSETDDLEYLRALAAEKRLAVGEAAALAARTEAYMASDADYLAYAPPDQKAQLAALIQNLRTVAAVKNIHDIGPTIFPVWEAIAAVQDHSATVRASVAAGKAAAETPPAPPAEALPEAGAP